MVFEHPYFCIRKKRISMAENRISHDGIVDSLEGNEVVVKITGYAACHECHARAACKVTEGNDKYLRLKSSSDDFRTGDRVRVFLDRSLGFRALFLGYILPFLLVMTALVIASALKCSELLAGGLSLSILAPYYMGLKLFRKKLDRQFSCFIQKT